MDLHVLFMQRKERYEGEFGPEALVCWDEYCIDENRDGFNEAIERVKAKHKNESAGFAVLRISIDGDKVRRMCLGTDHEIEGKIKS